MHARPAADGRDRPLRLRPEDAGLRVPARADLRERRARRRDQPRDAEDAVRAPRGDGRVPGHGRRRDAGAARPRSSCSRPRTRSSTRARSRCPRRSSTASSCGPRSATRASTTSCGSSSSSATRIRSTRSSPRSRSTRCTSSAPRRSTSTSTTVLHRWVVELVRATREQESVVIGSSVRGSLALERAARAWALLDGRGYVVPEDIERLFVPVLVHRVVFTPSFVARARATGWAEAIEEFRASCLELAPQAGLGGGSLLRAAAPRLGAAAPCAEAPGSRSRSFPGGGCTGSRSGRCGACAEGPGPTSPARGRTARATTWTRSTGRRRRGSRPRGAATSSSSASASPRRRRRSSSSATGARRWRTSRRRSPGWTSREAMRHTVELVLASAGAAGGFVGYLDYADGDPHWRQPKGERKLIELRDERLWSSGVRRPAGLARALDRASRRRTRARSAPGRSSSCSPTSSPRRRTSVWLDRDRAPLGPRPGRDPGSRPGSRASPT